MERGRERCREEEKDGEREREGREGKRESLKEREINLLVDYSRHFKWCMVNSSHDYNIAPPFRP